VGNGLVFVVLLFSSDQWKRLVPTSWQIVPDAWAVFVHYATFHLPPEPNGFLPLQRAAAAGVLRRCVRPGPLGDADRPFDVAGLHGPIPVVSEAARQPPGRAVDPLPHHVRLRRIYHRARDHGGTHRVRPEHEPHSGGYGQQQPNRSVPRPGWGRRGRPVKCIRQLDGVDTHPRAVQHAAKAIVTPVMGFLLDHSAPVAEFSREDISPFFWVNGKIPTCDEWKTLAAGDFKNYRLKVYGQLENPVELSLDDLLILGHKTQITLHHCIQGWSGIAEWGGLSLAELMKLVRPTPKAKTVVFFSFGEGVEFDTGVAGGQYYESLSIEDALNPQTMLAYEMNYEPLNHLHGAPLRLRVENQLGFKMVKWIQVIEFVEDVQSINKGEGGYAEDHEYFGELANI